MHDEGGFPAVIDSSLVGTYPAGAMAGGGLVWDAVLEYRVWCHPERGASDHEEGNDYFYAFADYADALEFSEATRGAEEPLALVVQEEYIDEPEPGRYIHVKERRVTEWSVELLRRPRTPRAIPEFLAPDVPPIDWTSFAASRGSDHYPAPTCDDHT